MAPQCGSPLLIIRFAFLEDLATAKCAHLRFHSSSRGVQRHISYFAILHILLCLSVDPLPVRPCALATVVAGKSPASFLERAAVIATDNSL